MSTTPLDLRSVDELLLEMQRTGFQDFVVDGLISSQVTTIVGNPFVGKTALTIDVARSLTTGEPFLGRPVLRQVDRVAFLCTDPGGRFAAARRVRDAGLDGRRVLAQQFYAPQSWDEWREGLSVLHGQGIGAVIVDNTTDLAQDANGPREVKLITDGLRLWSDDGAIIVNVHHLNKGPYRSLFGSLLWQKWTRAELMLSAVRGNLRRLVTKVNDATPSEMTLRFDPVSSPAYTVVTDRVPAQRERAPGRMDDHLRRAQWVVANCQGVSNVSDVARKLAAEFPALKFDSHRRMIGKHGGYPLQHDGSGGWRLTSG